MKKLLFLILFLTLAINSIIINAETITSQSYSIDSTQTVISGGSSSSNSYDATPSSSGQGSIVSSSYSGISGFSVYCNESWTCNDWTACSSSIQTRTCTDSDNCGSIDYRPALSQSCDSGDTPTSPGGGGGGGGGGPIPKKNSTINTTITTQQSNNNPETSANPQDNPESTAKGDQETARATENQKNILNKNTTKSTKWIMIVIVGGIIILALVIIGYFFFKKKKIRKNSRKI
jgi:hypothetical protein